MLRDGPIPQTVHGLLEYLVGALFVAAPFLFGFSEQGIATAAAIVLGLAFLVIAATSTSPTGLVKQVPPVVQVLLDTLMAALLIAAPFVLGFSDVTAPRNLFLLSGVLWLLVTIASRYGRKVPATPTGGTARPAPAPSSSSPQAPGSRGPAAAGPASPGPVGTSPASPGPLGGGASGAGPVGGSSGVGGSAPPTPGPRA